MRARAWQWPHDSTDLSRSTTPCGRTRTGSIGYLCLNYDDGTESILPIRYGVHLRDWYNLPSYEKEAVEDPYTTVCWRRPPAEYKAPIRLFKSRLANPSPQKVVKTMDIVSARSLAGYNVIAATVADRDAVRGELVGDRNFDGKLLIRVVDDFTGNRSRARWSIRA